MNEINNYLENVLYKFLSNYNLPSTVVDQISEDIHNRIYSLLQIWKDEQKRKAILTIGLEEASFYEPKDTYSKKELSLL